MTTIIIRSDGFVQPCIPSRAPKPPAGPGPVHEVKHDGYRLQVRRESSAVRLFTRRGFDWTERYPAIAAAALKLRARLFTLDGGGPSTPWNSTALKKNTAARNPPEQIFSMRLCTPRMTSL